MAATLPETVRWLDALLDAASFSDYGPNGLQVPGGEEIRRVVTGVSAQRELFERAVAADAQLVLVHHGLLWDFQPRRLDERRAGRLKLLLAHDIALAAYHLPLDAHPRIGNNALLADGLGAERAGREGFFAVKGRAIGVIARFPDDGVPVAELVARVAALCGREPLAFTAGPERVRSIAICSGSAADALDEAVARGADALLTGEPREHVMADAREAGIHFLAAGHYATETHGIRRLGELLAERFGLEHEWVDIPNPV